MCKKRCSRPTYIIRFMHRTCHTHTGQRCCVLPRTRCLLWPRSPISATAELLFPVLAKIQPNPACFVPRSDKFECQGQRSQGTKIRCALPSALPPSSDSMVCSDAWHIVTRSLQIAFYSSRWHHCVTTGGGGVISVPCMQFMFGKTSLALVLLVCLSLYIRYRCIQ